MSEESKDKQDKNIPEMKDAEYQKKVIEVRTILKGHEESKKVEIKNLAKMLEQKGYLKELIPEKLAEDLKGYTTKQYIKQVLEIKPDTSKKKEKNVTDEIHANVENDDKKLIEVSVGTNTQTTSEPTNQKPVITDPNDPNFNPFDLEEEPQQQQPEPQQQSKPNPEVIELDNENIKLMNQLKDANSRIFNLEQQIKTTSERKADNRNIKINEAMKKFDIKYEYDPKKLAYKDPTKVFDNTIVLSADSLDKLKQTITRLLSGGYSKSYFLLQQDFDDPKHIILNYLKTEFIANP